jgi:hypothetical protein
MPAARGLLLGCTDSVRILIVFARRRDGTDATGSLILTLAGQETTE